MRVAIPVTLGLADDPAELRVHVTRALRYHGYELADDTAITLERTFLVGDDGEEYEGFPMAMVDCL